MSTPGFTDHDHSVCVTTAITSAEALCAQKGLKFTKVRRRVLELLLREHRALGAYDILDRLREEGLGSQPPVAYRALEFLTSNGFAHRIERLNAFVACSHVGNVHTPAFLICRECDAVAETDSAMPRDALSKAAETVGFQVERAAVEAVGLCPQCVHGDSA